jgi:hypothetical protein
MLTQASTRSRPWLIDSPQYRTFVGICERNNWKTRVHLPRRGAREGTELDRFIDENSFSRDQVNRKFAHYKSTFESERQIRQLDVSKIEVTSGIFNLVKHSEAWRFGIQDQSISFYKEDQSTMLYPELLEDPIFIGELEKLRSNLIDAINHLLNGNKDDVHRAVEYRDIERSLMDQYKTACVALFLEHEKVKSEFCGINLQAAKMKAKSIFHRICHEFVQAFVKAIKRGGHGNSTMLELVNAAVASFDNSQIDLTENSMLNRTIYNIAGWLVKAAEKTCKKKLKDQPELKSALAKISEASGSVSSDHAKLQNLPTGKVDATFSKVAFRYPSASFYKFVRMVEAVCEKVLIERSLLIFGATVVDDLAETLSDIPSLLECVRECAFDTNPLQNPEIKPVAKFLVATYMKMRSRDFVRHIMGKSRKSLSPGTRPTLAVISQSGISVSKKEHSKKKVCFFCLDNTHLVPQCPEATIRPLTLNSERTMAIGDDSFTWHWCQHCNRWRRHSTREHSSSRNQDQVLEVEEEAEELNNEEVELAMLVEECLEMNDIVTNITSNI